MLRAVLAQRLRTPKIQKSKNPKPLEQHATVRTSGQVRGFECIEAVRGLIQKEGVLYVHARVLLRCGFLVRDLLQVLAQRSHFLSIMLRAVLALRLREPKIQNLSEGPETFGFFCFHRVFWFSNRNPKTHCVFGFPTEIKKTHGFLFFTRNLTKKQKKHVKSPKNNVFFWISVGKQKTLGKPKSCGPLRKVLDFCFLVSTVVKCGL